MAAILALMLSLGAQSGYSPAPVSGTPILDQVPFVNIRDLFNKGGQVVSALKATASFAYDDASSIGGASLESARKRLLRLESVQSVLGRSNNASADQLNAGLNNNDNDNNNNSNNNNCTTGAGNSGSCAPKDPDASRNVSEIIRSRGFLAEEYDVITRDGYILIIQRIINPLVDASARDKLKPVILQHGLMSSSVDWVINSVDVRPSKFPKQQQQRRRRGASAAGADANATASSSSAASINGLGSGDTQESPNSLGYYLANEGYDVFLANSRGNIYGQRHVRLTRWQPAFWSFTFDEQIKYDLPAIIEFVQRLTKQTKLGYVGHSQGTTMALGLLADEPDYADVLEPVVLLAPVAYVNHCISPAKYFSIYTPVFSHINMWFGSSNKAVAYLGPIVCGPKVVRRDICENLIFLATGFDEAQFNDTRVSAYLAHMPSGTSVKNIAHWGQEVISGRFAHFDHGILGNQARYGVARAPDYDIGKIRSKSLALFVADNDWLASPKDVARLRAELKQPLATLVNVTEFLPAWNHIDFLYGKDCGRLVNRHVVDLFHKYDVK